jgi:hypothetical protein
VLNNATKPYTGKLPINLPTTVMGCFVVDEVMADWFAGPQSRAKKRAQAQTMREVEESPGKPEDKDRRWP